LKPVCEYINSNLEKFISKSYTKNKHDEKYQENRHFDLWFLENSRKFKNKK